MTLTPADLTHAGWDVDTVALWFPVIERALTHENAMDRWVDLATNVLTPDHPFPVHQILYHAAFTRGWDASKDGPAPAWWPTPSEIQASNVGRLIKEMAEVTTYHDLYQWSIAHRGAYWDTMARRLIHFKSPYLVPLDLSNGVEHTQFFCSGKLNITDSCFHKNKLDAIAIIHKAEGGSTQRTTYGALEKLVNRVANGLVKAGFRRGDALAIDMVMTMESVAIYLGIIKAGCVAVSIADSFVAAEIALRLRIAQCKGIFTQDVIWRGGKTIPLYPRVCEANAPRAIVLAGSPDGGELVEGLRVGDVSWEAFLSDDTTFDSVPCDPDDASNILFSSGTTGDPKAIPWTHATPIKAAVDGHLHIDIRIGDVVCWPTNLGWMMGPWLIYAGLVNGASIALYSGAPTTRGFCEFVQEVKVSMLGIVPTIARVWRQNGLMDGMDLSALRCFASTGEASNAMDYLWLMGRAKGYRPVIEYCGGTEIGGAYVTGTLVQPQSPATFSTPALGMELYIMSHDGLPTSNGELALIPPSVGLTTTLLNRNHHDVYFQMMPETPDGRTLRRHGDSMELLAGGYYRAHGRVDDTMKLGGIKTSSSEIEEVCGRMAALAECAAVAVEPSHGGPSRLVIFVVLKNHHVTPTDLQKGMQHNLRTMLNPLFKIDEVVVLPELPRTASNKIMRRVLRNEYKPRAEENGGE